MAYRIRDKYTFEEFNSIEEFSTSLNDNKWKRHIPTKKVKIKGRETLGIRLQDKGTKGIFVKLDFSKILKEIGMEKPVKQQPDFETFLVKNKHRKNVITYKEEGSKGSVLSSFLILTNWITVNVNNVKIRMADKVQKKQKDFIRKAWANINQILINVADNVKQNSKK